MARHPLHRRLLGRLRRRLRPVDVRVDRVSQQLDALAEHVADLQAEFNRPSGFAGALAVEVARLQLELDATRGRLAHAESRLPDRDRLERLEHLLASAALLERVGPEGEPLISVVLPTRDRLTLLQRAVASVLDQSYPHWELLVVDDTSADGTGAWLEQLDDARVRVLQGAGAGAGAARNVALEAAKGEVVAYLDDDNQMGARWLQAVAWASERWPEAEVFYGARVLDDAREALGANPGRLPRLDLRTWDRQALLEGNYIDTSALAHRHPLGGARFDEHLASHQDWDLVLRLTRDHAAVVLPVWSVVYRTDGPGRISERPGRNDDYQLIRTRARAGEPLRVLAYNAMFPLLCETYVSEELEALARNGAAIAYCSEGPRPSPMPIDRTFFHRFGDALERFRPDVLLLHWTTFAVHELDTLEQVGLPFGVRVHSFDHDPALIARLLDHPLCIGVWCYPHVAVRTPGTLALPSLFAGVDDLPQPTGPRDLITSVSAALPKKQWDLVFDVMAQLQGSPRRIVVAATQTFEQLPSELIDRAQRIVDPPLVQVNLTRAQVLETLAHTSVLLYTVEPGVPLGNPMSVIEAMVSGACVVVPDHPDARGFVGPGFRGYRTAGDIVRHVGEVQLGGPEIEAERDRNRAWAREHHGDPALGARFADELHDRLAAHRASPSVAEHA